MVPQFLGGAKAALIGNVIQERFLSQPQDWPLGSALALVVMLVISLAIWAYFKFAREEMPLVRPLQMQMTHVRRGSSTASSRRSWCSMPCWPTASCIFRSPCWSCSASAPAVTPASGEGFLEWYAKLFHNVAQALLNSLLIAAATALIATVLGTLAAVGVERLPDRRRASHITTRR